jgi:hypothetical protein
MVKELTVAQLRQRLEAALDRAEREGAVRIRRKDGRTFVLRPEAPAASPLDVRAIGARLRREDILDAIREGRRPA